MLRPVAGIGVSGDFVLYSPHKNLPIPDGAVLVVRPEGPAGFDDAALSIFGTPETWPQQLSELEQGMGLLVRKSGRRTSLWLAKRLLQKLGVGRRSTVAAAFEEPEPSNKFDGAPLNEAAQSGLSRHLLTFLIPRLVNISSLRQRYQLLWDFTLIDAGDSTSVLSAAERPSGRAWTPYLASYCVDVEGVRRIYGQLQRQGIPVTTWPDLAPEVLGHPGRHANAMHLRHTRLYVPVHQSLRPRDLVGKACVPAHGRQRGLEGVWNQASADQWMQWIVQTGRSNLLQTWAYGQAKSTESGWRVSQCVFYRGIEPVAFVQVLYKRIAGLLKVSRINRGPLLLSDLSAADMREVVAELGKLGSLWRGSILSMAPELTLTGPNLALMSSLGFKQFFRGAWQSAWVNLRMETAALRQQLESKWRNVLNFSEKSGLTLDVRDDDESFNWMIDRYQELMREKEFTGSPVDLLTALRKNLPAGSNLIVMRALHENSAVAGICIACHGVAATYLLGWNGDVGRDLKANQYLLWQATLYLKSEGLGWFDLGGIDEHQTPGIAAFKLGFGAERYELVGEYWKW